MTLQSKPGIQEIAAPSLISRRLRDVAALFALGLVVNGAVALLVNSPAYTDAFYYFNAGVRIASGQMHFPELLEPYIWNYLAAPRSLPTPAFTYWQPLPAFLAALGIRLFGPEPAFGSAQTIFVLLAATLPLVAYWVALQLGTRRHALLAGALAAFSGIYVVYWSLPESFTPFALSAALSLGLAGLGRRSWCWWTWLLGGVCAGFAHLARADGLLLVGVVALVAVLPVRSSAPAQGGHVGPPVWGRLALAGLSLAGYAVVMGPWYARNLAVFGSLQAPGGPSTLWLVDYNDMFSYPPRLTPKGYFAAGWQSILATKWQALKGNLATFVGVQNLVFLTPFALLGWGKRWRAEGLLPATLYGLALFAAMTFAFSLPGVRGGWLHSGAALVPYLAAAATLGLEDAVRWAAKRRRGWRASEAWRVFGAASAVFALLVTVTMVILRVVGLGDLSTVAWNRSTSVYDAVSAALDWDGAPLEARVMSNNPPGLYAHTGRGGIPLVNGGEADLLRAADDYGATYVVLDRNVPAGLSGLYWEGPASPRLVLVSTAGAAPDRVQLYRILPPH